MVIIRNGFKIVVVNHPCFGGVKFYINGNEKYYVIIPSTSKYFSPNQTILSPSMYDLIAIKYCNCKIWVSIGSKLMGKEWWILLRMLAEDIVKRSLILISDN